MWSWEIQGKVMARVGVVLVDTCLNIQAGRFLTFPRHHFTHFPLPIALNSSLVEIKHLIVTRNLVFWNVIHDSDIHSAGVDSDGLFANSGDRVICTF